MPASAFHPAVAAWFDKTFAAPTEVQAGAWPAIRDGRHTLLAAPTGSGKTLAAFLAAIDSLVREGLERGLPDETRVLYISPLKALSNDIQRNLQQPLKGIREELLAQGTPDVDVRAWVRTGDTPQSERQKARRQPPHILVTTPESAYILLTSESGRQMLSTVRTVIVDEIHALAGNKRGAHLSLSLERLEALCRQPINRVGLSATQKPIEDMASFLIGKRDASCTIIDTGHVRDRDLALEIPGSPLEAVMSNEVWAEIYNHLETLIQAHRTTLIFVNTRRLAERAARFLAERIGEENVTSHHGSLAKEHRLAAEQRLKGGGLKCLVATSSLELGIDIGEVDLVCQLGSPRSITAFLQRVGRSGHAIGATPKGRLFPLSRDDLVESVALLDAAHRGELDRINIPHQPRDVLAQQIVAEVSGDEWDENELFEQFRRAWPYRALTKDEFSQVVRMLAQGFSTRRGRRAAHIHYDAVNGKLRGRRGARLTAITNGGAIPDQFDYDVILSPDGMRIGSLNEDFAFESIPGDIFQLGNTSYRILKIEQGKVHVQDAKGEPPNIPFWFGEAPGRTDELSASVSRLRADIDKQLANGMEATIQWLVSEYKVSPAAAEQLITYLAAARAALEVIPTQEKIVFERFFDEAGDMHLVIHAPFGSRINRAWGLSLRKRFCRKFNFELQAAALEDSVILSLAITHSFPLEEVATYLHSNTVRDVLKQALLAAPMFAARWRWNSTIALAVRRNKNGKRVPAYFQRADAEDLVAVVFPDQIACAENITGQREIPDHPLVNQTVADCLYETMDIDGLEAVLRKLEAGEIEVIGRDLTGPSPLAQEILSARPYAFLDDAPAEERRTMAVRSRSFMDPADAADLGRLDGAAIDKVREEAWPEVRTADELHDALVLLGFITEEEANRSQIGKGLDFGWPHLFDELRSQNRATESRLASGQKLWIAAERLADFEQLNIEFTAHPIIAAVVTGQRPADRSDALKEIIRSRLEGLGPITAEQLGAPVGVPRDEVDIALLGLEQEGFVVRGHFSCRTTQTEEWCERRLLARIHRYTIKRLRSEIEPVSPADFMRFLFHWQGLTDKGEGQEALARVLDQLEGFPLAAGAWETDILSARMHRYSADQLDALCTSGRTTWVRLAVATVNSDRKSSPVRHSPVALVSREHIGHWRALSPLPEEENINLSTPAETVLNELLAHGASFFVDLVRETGMLRTQIEEALGELVNWGLVTSDNFAGLRALITPQSRRPGFAPRRGRRPAASPFDRAGRWSLINQAEDRSLKAEGDATFRFPLPASRSDTVLGPSSDDIEFLARVFLRRYGIVFRKGLDREAILPPWRDLLRVYWRMEARGEIRGGRFVQGVSGEQFGLPDAVATLRDIRRRAKTDELVVVAASDPLNLVGTVLPGDRIPATLNNRVLFRDGTPAMIQTGGDLELLTELDAETEWQARSLLLRRRRPASFLSGPSRPL
ncbi:MAG: DEAD/DEAH box helicase [Gammaproteobacteria bacterium]